MTAIKDFCVQKTGKPLFIDVFAGCGGLSLGLVKAGWNGFFAIEKDAFAFATLKTNLISDSTAYSWPSWLKQEPHCIEKLLEKYSEELAELSGQIDLIAGGPPCQGFSSAGRRIATDPRNRLITSYFALVNLIKPKIVLVENVNGIALDFKIEDGTINYADMISSELGCSYCVYNKLVNVSQFGVPQNRKRYFVIAIRKDCLGAKDNPFDDLQLLRNGYLSSKGLPELVSSKEAISDLEIESFGLKPYSNDFKYRSVDYKGPVTTFQKLMHGDCGGVVSDTRLAIHRETTVKKFDSIIKICKAEKRLNISLSKEVKSMFGIKKSAIRVMDPSRPSPTITSMPDDLIHYDEPRTLTVRENARLQSFPDWYVFCGKYTSGGERRKKEVPRFTQVANAVPPLMAEAIGSVLYARIISESKHCGDKLVLQATHA